MALYAFDGTGNDDRDDTDVGGFDSNVLHFFRAFQDPGKDFAEGRDTGSLYLKGIGRRAQTHTGTVVAEAFGIGGHFRVGIMLDRLAANCTAGDTTVDVIGFSRGAALAVSFANGYTITSEGKDGTGGTTTCAGSPSCSLLSDSIIYSNGQFVQYPAGPQR